MLPAGGIPNQDMLFLWLADLFTLLGRKELSLCDSQKDTWRPNFIEKAK
jgi:hypothetical protein